MSVTKLDVQFRRAPQVSPREIWDQAEPPPEMVWEVCPYLRGHLDESRCQQCPPWEDDPAHGKVSRGCYGLAGEVCRIVFAMLVRHTNDDQARKP
jgi:hypothetical protein